MFSSMIFIRFTKKTPSLPFFFRDIGFLVIGYTIGTQFSKETLLEMITHFPSMFLMTIIMIIFSFGLAFITSKITKSNLKSTIAGSIPGGLTQMIAISSEMKGIDLTVVTLIQVSRILSVIILVPLLVYSPVLDGVDAYPTIGNAANPSYHWYLFALLLIGYLIAKLVKKWKFPAPFIIGPLLFIASLAISGYEIPLIPTSLSSIAQILIGISLGFQIKFGKMEHKAKFISVAFVSSFFLVLFSLLLGFLLTRVDDNIHLLTAFIGLAPGGMAEMAVLGGAVGADLPIITTYQLFRLLFILFIVPLVMKWAFGKIDRMREKEQ